MTRIGFRIGSLWVSERLPRMSWPPRPRTLALLAILVALAWIVQKI